MDIYQRLFPAEWLIPFHCSIVRRSAQSPILDTRTLRELRGLAQEVQLEINTVLLNPLELTEMNDRTQFGKVRKTMEKTLKGQNQNYANINSVFSLWISIRLYA
jgi:hypothetical protein